MHWMSFCESAGTAGPTSLMDPTMGIDILDIRFRLEKRFDVALIRQQFDTDLSELWYSHQPPDITAGEMYELVLQELKRQNREVPAESWELFCSCVSESLGLAVHEIQREEWMGAELGMS